MQLTDKSIGPVGSQIEKKKRPQFTRTKWKIRPSSQGKSSCFPSQAYVVLYWIRPGYVLDRKWRKKKYKVVGKMLSRSIKRFGRLSIFMSTNQQELLLFKEKEKRTGEEKGKEEKYFVMCFVFWWDGQSNSSSSRSWFMMMAIIFSFRRHWSKKEKNMVRDSHHWFHMFPDVCCCSRYYWSVTLVTASAEKLLFSLPRETLFYRVFYGITKRNPSFFYSSLLDFSWVSPSIVIIIIIFSGSMTIHDDQLSLSSSFSLSLAPFSCLYGLNCDFVCFFPFHFPHDVPLASLTGHMIRLHGTPRERNREKEVIIH